MTRTREQQVAAALVLGGLLLVYWPVATGLVGAWSTDDNYSHGFFIVPLAAYFAWERRHAFAAMPVRPSWLSLLVAAGSMVMLIGGLLVMLGLYTGWGLWEITSLPPATLP